MAFENLQQAVFDTDEVLTVEIVKEELAKGASPKELFDALGEAMTEVGVRFQKMEFFLPEVVLASDCMKAASEILIPEMAKTNTMGKLKGTIMIGTVKGDVHTVGKDMVIGTLSTNGYKVMDLGKDVPPDVFIETAEQMKADIIALSALMSSTMPNQREVISFLEAKGMRDKFKVLVGGGVVTPEYAKKIGADGYAKDAVDAVKEVNRLMGLK